MLRSFQTWEGALLARETNSKSETYTEQRGSVLGCAQKGGGKVFTRQEVRYQIMMGTVTLEKINQEQINSFMN